MYVQGSVADDKESATHIVYPLPPPSQDGEYVLKQLIVVVYGNLAMYRISSSKN